MSKRLEVSINGSLLSNFDKEVFRSVVFWKSLVSYPKLSDSWEIPSLHMCQTWHFQSVMNSFSSCYCSNFTVCLYCPSQYTALFRKESKLFAEGMCIKTCANFILSCSKNNGREGEEELQQDVAVQLYGKMVRWPLSS